VAFKICTTGGACIKCGGSADNIVDQLEAAEKRGQKYWCCGSGGEMSCVRIDQITTITEARLPDDDDDDDDDDGRPILGNPDIVILTGGQKALRKPRQRRAAPADAEPATRDDEEGRD
jgi:hypothetical protein